MGLFARFAAPFARAAGRGATGRQATELDRRFAELAARLELHTLNLTEHQAQLRDEGLRRIVDEMRANSAFLADSVVALEEASGRRSAALHTVVRPIVHQSRGDALTALCTGLVDPTLVEELAAANLDVTVVDPAMEFSYRVPVAVVNRALGSYAGPERRQGLIVWVSAQQPKAHDVDRVGSWLGKSGVLVVASPLPIDLPTGCDRKRRLHATDAGGRYRICGEADASVLIDVFRAP